MLNTLDTVIAFAVIMTILSLLITILVQTASAALSLRGKNLANALALTFQTIDPKIGEYAHSLAAQILRDPIFSDSILQSKNRPPVIPGEKAQAIIDLEKKARDAEQQLAADPQDVAKKKAAEDANAELAAMKSEITAAEEKLANAEQELAKDEKNTAKQTAVKNAKTELVQAKAKLEIPDVTQNRMHPWGVFSKLRDAMALGSAIRPGEVYRLLHDIANLTETQAAVRDIPPDLVKKTVALLACLKQQDQPAEESNEKLRVIREVADKFSTPEQRKAVLDSLANFGLTVERATTEAYDRFQRWFGSAQDRAEQWFQTHVRIVTIFCSICAALVLQLDTADVYRQLSANPVLVQGLSKAASSVLEEGGKILDPNNTPAYQAYVQWKEKHPEQALAALPTSPTAADYREALKAQLTKTNVPAKEAQALLADYDGLYNNAAKKFEASNREQVERLKKTADDAGFDLMPVSFFGRWDQPRDDDIHGLTRLRRQMGHTLPHLLGILATAGLLSLGAPFWFNLLKNLMSLRPAVASLIEKRPTSAPALPPSPSSPPSPS